MTLDSYIAKRFAERSVRFYHAENLRNLVTYASAGGVVCREDLMQADPSGFTRFYSDPHDAVLGVLGRVYGNIYDFGQIFARAVGAVPNIYGPITLVFRPDVFAVMHDIRITRQSVATLKEGWLAASLSTEAQIEELVAGDNYGSPISGHWYSAELSCANRTIPFTHLERVVVEPVVVGGYNLIDVVRARLSARGISAPVELRQYRTNVYFLPALVRFCEALPLDSTAREAALTVESLPPQANVITDPELRARLVGWCRYFAAGTVDPMRRGDT